MILCSAEPRIISCLPTHVINLVINDNSLEILYIYIVHIRLIFKCLCCSDNVDTFGVNKQDHNKKEHTEQEYHYIFI